jgi:hypothetical protein
MKPRSIEVSANDLVLVSLVEFAEVTAPAPNANEEVLGPFGMALGIAQRVQVQRVELQLLAAGSHESADEKRNGSSCLSIDKEVTGKWQTKSMTKIRQAA